MKNIHLIPTDKPSRLLKTIPKGNLILSKSITSGSHWENQNIYMTSNEEIKMDDWYLDDTNSVRQAITECESYWTHRKKYQKIILTTDPKLIEDGVQAIDDEFLEWFVKNPSCEEVEVSYEVLKPFESENKGYLIHCPDNEPLEEPKQETLEEGASKWSLEEAQEFALSRFKNENLLLEGFVSLESILKVLKAGILTGHKFGAKWQAERMYSEEEVLELLHKRMSYTLGAEYKKETTLEWFEQFKT